MDLRSGLPYSMLRYGLTRTYPSLQQNVNTHVAIIGGGISGALCAWHLMEAGLEVVLVDRRHIGTGSTAASTSLLQYEIDTPLTELIKKVGELNAVRSYCLSRDAIHMLATIAGKLGLKDNFQLKPSFQYASYIHHAKALEAEYRQRRKIGFLIEWLDSKDIHDRYGFKKPCGILSEDGGDTDAYQLTHALLQNVRSQGLKIFDHTEIVDIRHKKNGVELLTAERKRINARKLIIACGYESQRYIPKKIQQLNSTFVILSEPTKKDPWYRNSLIWETRNPYLYLRSTADHRIVVGGKDIDSPDATLRDKLLHVKAKALEKSFQQLFPTIKFRTDFEWAGTFASTKDGLPYIGSIPERAHTFFALGLGGNGITFSVVAAQIIRDSICGKHNPDAAVYSFNR